MHRRPLLSAPNHPLEPLARPCALLLVARLGRAEVKDDAAAARAARRWPSTEKTKRARRLRPRAAISQAIRARRNPSPRGSYRSAAWAMASAAPCEAVRARAARPPAASARAAGSVSAVVVTSASMREMAVFIGLISV